MDNSDTVALVQEAKRNNASAWNELVRRYYDRWLEKFGGSLGSTIRRTRGAEDLLQSALRDAVRDVGALRNERAFFA